MRRVDDRSAVRWRMQCAALADAVRCVGECSALRWRMQCAALADAVRCCFDSSPLGGGWERDFLSCVTKVRYILLPLGEGGGRGLDGRGRGDFGGDCRALTFSESRAGVAVTLPYAGYAGAVPVFHQAACHPCTTHTAKLPLGLRASCSCQEAARRGGRRNAREHLDVQVKEAPARRLRP